MPLFSRVRIYRFTWEPKGKSPESKNSLNKVKKGKLKREAERESGWQCFSDFNVHSNHVTVDKKADFDSGGLQWGLRFCVSNKLPW